MTTVSETLWVEAHRPETLDDIVGHEHIVKRLKEYLDDPAMPHLLFHGQQGVGKTAMIVAFAKELYGESWRTNMMELNASDERGISTIRDKVSDRAVQGPTDTDRPFQIIFLDEADSLTNEAQSAFRRTMEDYADVTRFILSCNYPSEIIDPILSRCAKFAVSPLEDDEIMEVLMNVADKEGVETEEKALEYIVSATRGDARDAIMTFQTSEYEGKVRVEDVDAIVGTVNDDDVKAVVEMAIEGEVDEAMQRLDDKFLKEGVPHQMLMDSFLRVAKGIDVPGYARAKVMNKLAETDRALSHTGNPRIQFHSLLCDFYAAPHLPPIGKEAATPE